MDIMSDNSITFRQFAISFFKSRAKNKESFYKTLDLIRDEVKKINVIDSKEMHPSLFENLED